MNDHPMRKEIDALRKIILGVSPAIGEIVKWNAPSFRTTEDFLTFHLRATDQIRLVFHTGATTKSDAKAMKDAIPDPAGLMKWAAKDRAVVTLTNAKDIAAKRTALRSIIRAWIALL